MITIVTREDCPYCIMAKDLISFLWFEYKEIDITGDSEKTMEISQISQMRTVPQIFNGDISRENLLGGYSDIKKLNDEWELIWLLSK